MHKSKPHTEELDELGFTMLPRWIPPPLLEELRTTVAHLYSIEGSNAGGEFKQEPGCLRLANLVGKGTVFQQVIAAPTILALVEHVLGGDFKLSSLNARTALPNCGVQPLHADMGAVADDHGYWVCNSIWMLDDYSTDNAPIRVVPGSHRWRKLPQDELSDTRSIHPAEMVITAGAGTILVMNAHLWHGGLDNRTTEPRTALHAFYCRSDKPQQQYQKRLISPDVQSRLSPELRRLLAIDDALNDELARKVFVRSGFLK